MEKLTLSIENKEALFKDDYDDKLGFEVVKREEWDDEGKYSTCRLIIKHKETGKFYAFPVTRSGSYYSDYDYDYWDDSLCEVEQQEVTTVQWVEVK